MNIILVLDATFVFQIIFFPCFIFRSLLVSTIELNVNFSFYIYANETLFLVEMMAFLHSMVPWSSKEMELTKKTKHQRLNLDDEVSDFNDFVYFIESQQNSHISVIDLTNKRNY